MCEQSRQNVMNKQADVEKENEQQPEADRW